MGLGAQRRSDDSLHPEPLILSSQRESVRDLVMQFVTR